MKIYIAFILVFLWADASYGSLGKLGIEFDFEKAAKWQLLKDFNAVHEDDCPATAVQVPHSSPFRNCWKFEEVKQFGICPFKSGLFKTFNKRLTYKNVFCYLP